MYYWKGSKLKQVKGKHIQTVNSLKMSSKGFNLGILCCGILFVTFTMYLCSYVYSAVILVSALESDQKKKSNLHPHSNHFFLRVFTCSQKWIDICEKFCPLPTIILPIDISKKHSSVVELVGIISCFCNIKWSCKPQGLHR